MLIKPVSFITGGVSTEYFTRVIVTASTNYGYPRNVDPPLYNNDAGIELGTTAIGGNPPPLVTLAYRTAAPSHDYDFDLSSLSINWDDKYNYRFGCANVYVVSRIRLYKDGVLAVDNSSLGINFINLDANKNYYWRHMGVNLDTTVPSQTITDDGTYPRNFAL